MCWRNKKMWWVGALEEALWAWKAKKEPASKPWSREELPTLQQLARRKVRRWSTMLGPEPATWQWAFPIWRDVSRDRGHFYFSHSELDTCADHIFQTVFFSGYLTSTSILKLEYLFAFGSTLLTSLLSKGKRHLESVAETLDWRTKVCTIHFSSEGK